jgi:hypothetical protein
MAVMLAGALVTVKIPTFVGLVLGRLIDSKRERVNSSAAETGQQ